MTNTLDKAINTLFEEEGETFKVPNGIVAFDRIDSVESDIQGSVKVNYEGGGNRIIPFPLSAEFMDWFSDLSTEE